MRSLRLLLVVASFASPFLALRPKKISPLNSALHGKTPLTPSTPGEASLRDLRGAMKHALLVASAAVCLPRRGDAIGKLFEFKEAPVIFQDISFNVGNTNTVTEFFEATFPELCSVLRNSRVGNKNSTVIGFGAEAYESPKSFLPGVSSFYENGGHATLSFQSEEVGEDTVALYETGNGLQFIKIGIENFRISKAMEKGRQSFDSFESCCIDDFLGAKIKYAYGWVDLEGPSAIPLQLVVGVARDPLMLACIRVSNMQQSVDFFSKDLGMKQMPFPFARAPGSTFEQQQPDKSVFLSFAKDSMGLLLVPGGKEDPPLNVGTELKAFNFVVDDVSSDASLPPLAQAFLDGGASTVFSPDGYPIALTKYSDFSKVASKALLAR